MDLSEVQDSDLRAKILPKPAVHQYFASISATRPRKAGSILFCAVRGRWRSKIFSQSSFSKKFRSILKNFFLTQNFHFDLNGAFRALRESGMISRFECATGYGDAGFVRSTFCLTRQRQKSFCDFFYCNLLNSNVLYAACGVTEKRASQNKTVNALSINGGGTS